MMHTCEVRQGWEISALKMSFPSNGSAAEVTDVAAQGVKCEHTRLLVWTAVACVRLKLLQTKHKRRTTA